MKLFGIIALVIVSSSTFAQDESETPETIWVDSEEQFSCTPKTISLGESVNVTLGSKAFRELAVYREAEKTWLFLVVGSAPKAMESLMSPTELKATSSITLKSKTKGFRWDSKGYNEQIFKYPGKYIIYNSDILESEMGGYKCEIEVIGN